MVCSLYSSAIAVREKFLFCFRSWWIETHSSGPQLFLPREQKSSASSSCPRLVQAAACQDSWKHRYGPSLGPVHISPL